MIFIHSILSAYHLPDTVLDAKNCPKIKLGSDENGELGNLGL